MEIIGKSQVEAVIICKTEQLEKKRFSLLLYPLAAVEECDATEAECLF